MRALDSCDLRSHSDRYNPAGAAGPAQPSKRNILRACDLCRTKKIKCDGPKMPNHFCTGCRQVSRPCTYVSVSFYYTSSLYAHTPPAKHPNHVDHRKRTSFTGCIFVALLDVHGSTTVSYVTGLEDRLEELEELLSQVRCSPYNPIRIPLSIHCPSCDQTPIFRRYSDHLLSEAHGKQIIPVTRPIGASNDLPLLRLNSPSLPLLIATLPISFSHQPPVSNAMQRVNHRSERNTAIASMNTPLTTPTMLLWTIWHAQRG